MLRSLFVSSAFALIVAGSDVPSASADGLPVRVDFTIRFDVDFDNRPTYKNLAPWYSYFPYDPHIHGRAPQYPSWPQTWPPVAPMPRKTTAAAPIPPATRIGYQPMPTAVQPASWSQAVNPPAPLMSYQVPSYWYGR